MSTVHRRFDAPRQPSEGSAALGFVGAHWGVVLALVVIVAVLLGAALGLLCRDVAVADEAADAVRAVTIAVVVEPQASAADVQALGPRLAAIPGVGSTRLRSRDDGLRTLAAAGLPAPDGRNPLPDLWLLKLEPALLLAGPSEVPATVEAVRKAAAAQGQAASVRIDDESVASARIVVQRWRHSAPIVLDCGLTLLALVTASVGYLAGGAVRRSPPSGWLALALMALIAVIGGAVIIGMSVAMLSTVNGSTLQALQALILQTLAARGIACGLVVVGALLCTGLGLAAGGERAAFDS